MLFYGTRKTQKLDRPGALIGRRDPFEFFNIHSLAKHPKIEGDPLEKKIEKSLTISELGFPKKRAYRLLRL